MKTRLLIQGMLGGLLLSGSGDGLSVSNGQMLILLSPERPVSEVRVSGLNQRGQWSVWQGSPGTNTLALTGNWWWKGRVSLEFRSAGRQERCSVQGLGQGFPIVFVEVVPAGGCRGDAQNSRFPEWEVAAERYVASRWPVLSLVARQQAFARLSREAEHLNRSRDGYTELRKQLGLKAK